MLIKGRLKERKKNMFDTVPYLPKEVIRKQRKQDLDFNSPEIRSLILNLNLGNGVECKVIKGKGSLDNLVITRQATFFLSGDKAVSAETVNRILKHIKYLKTQWLSKEIKIQQLSLPEDGSNPRTFTVVDPKDPNNLLREQIINVQDEKEKLNKKTTYRFKG